MSAFPFSSGNLPSVSCHNQVVGATFLIMLTCMGGSCSSIDPSAEQPPAGPVREIAVGGFDSSDPDRQRIARHFRRELAARLRDSEAFEAVLLPPPPRLPADAVLVTGRMTDVSDGSDALRFLIGGGLGASSVNARIELQDAAGQTLAVFEDSRHAAQSSLSMTPWAGTDADEVAAAMADGTAEAIIRWSKGEGLEPSLWDLLLTSAGI
jgi:hypothetical protein